MIRLIKASNSKRTKRNNLQPESLEARVVLAAVLFSEQIIIDDLDADGAAAIATADIDGDSDLDVVVGSYRDNQIAWFENIGEQRFTQHTISNDMTEIRSVLAQDIDGDGDTDVVAGAYGDDRIYWFENRGDGTFLPETTITSAANGVIALATGDLDEDGDLDLVSGSVLDNKIAWYENLGEGFFALQKVISTEPLAPRSVKVTDIDGDDHLDVVVASRSDDSVSWFGGSGDGSLGLRQEIDTNVNGPQDIEVGDIDNDGDMDIVTAVYSGSEIVWHENRGDGTFEPEVQLSGGTLRGTSVSVADLDGDGDLDVIAGSYFNDATEEDKVTWFENLDGNGTFKREQFLALNDTVGVQMVLAADLDGDGDLDVMSASQIDNKVTWYENDGNARFGPQISVLSDASGAATIDVADFDGDGDPDILASSFWDNGVAWYENLGNAEFSTERVITNSAQRVQGVRAGDLDGDGDMDALSASFRGNKISWYENTDGKGNFGPPIHLNTFANGALDVFVADLDNDGDLDVLGSSITDSIVAWYENLDGNGNFSARKIVTRLGIKPEWVSAADVDGDGDLDVLSAAYEDGRISWVENLDGKGDFSGGTNTVHLGLTADTVDAIDLDGDGDLDLAVTLWDTGELVWYENIDGKGTFSNSSERVTGGLSGVDTLFIADIDGNGVDDMLTASSTEIIWAERVGEGFDTHSISGNVDGVLDVHAVDLDLDGDLDVLSSSILDSKIAWYRNESANSGTEGDFDGDQDVDAEDIDALCAEIRSREHNLAFDLDLDGRVNDDDLNHMITDILKTTAGDANLDGVFDTTDLVHVFQIAEYEDGIDGNSGWADGDWNCDGNFDTRDLVDAFVAGGFENFAVSSTFGSNLRLNPSHVAAAIGYRLHFSVLKY